MPQRRSRTPLVSALRLTLVGLVVAAGVSFGVRRLGTGATGSGDRVVGSQPAVAASGPRRHVVEPDPVPSTAAPATAAPATAARSSERVTPDRTLVLAFEPRRDGEPGDIARELLRENRGALGLEAMPGELRLEREIDSLSAHHVRFVQTDRGVPVFGSRVSAHVAWDGRPLLLRADVYPIRGVAGVPDATTPRITTEAAAEAAIALLRDGDGDWEEDGNWEGDESGVEARVVSAPELVILPRGREGVLAWHVGVRTPAETLRVFVDAIDGAVLRADDGRVAADGRGMVFQPNPIHSSGNGSLRDQNDRDQAALTNQMELVTLPRLDGTGYLVGDWANLRDSPISTFEADLDWSWVSRSHHAFEQVNAYYHVDRVQNRFQSLGLVNVNAESQRVDAHAAEHDQSIYDIFDDRLEFGDGGVDDAEDGDIIVHEYGHAVQFDQVGTFGLTGEGGAMGEGFGDFLAVVFHESGRPAWDPLFGSWDSSAFVDRDPPYLRRVDRDKRFPEDFEDQVHADGEIWSRFLMDLRYLIGADDALRVVIESHFLLTPNARFRNACDALLVTNIAVREGRDDASIRALLDARGLPYLVPNAPLPPEEASEDNDTMETAAALAPGRHEQLLLADEDWFRVAVPPFRRVLVRADFDSAGLDLDLEAYTASGARAAFSAEAGGVEEIAVSGGSEGGVVFVRCHFGDPGEIAAGAYDLTVTETDLEAFGPVQTIVRDLEPGATWAFRVSVAPSKVVGGARLRVKTRKLKRGAKTDLRLFTPEGVELIDATTARRKKGGKAVVDVEQSGDWIGVVNAREGQDGRVKLKIKLK